MESNEVFIQCIKYIESSITHHNTPASTDELLLYPTSSPTLHPLSPFLLYRTPSLAAPPTSIFLIYTSSSQSFLSSTFCVYICVAPLGSCIDQGQCVRKEDGSAVNVSSASPSIYLNECDNSRTWRWRRRGLQVRQDMHRCHLSFFNFLPPTWT